MKLFIFVLTLITHTSFAHAQSPIGASDEPIEITAQQSLEWHRNDLKYIARGSAIATQGTTSIAGETLTADYESTAQSNIDIQRLTALDNVIVSDEDSKAYGDKAVYDIKTQTATLTGQNLKLVSPDQTITASESFVYKTAERKAIANGNAKVVRAKDTIEANRIEAIFKEEGGQGQDAIERMDAIDNVVITTPTEILSGNRAVYKSATNKAEIIGNVKIKRGPNILEGGRAEVDLTTNISKMFGSKSTGERVRGVFYPNSEKDKQDQTNTSE